MIFDLIDVAIKYGKLILMGDLLYLTNFDSSALLTLKTTFASNF